MISSLQAPFTTTLLEKDALPLTCESLLRSLPGKRDVFCGRWGSHEVIVKLFYGRHARRHWQREKRGSDSLRNLGISTPQLLYAGALKSGKPVLLYARLAKPITALEAWTQAEDDQSHREILALLSQLIGRMHKKGLVQTDIHLNNFLFSRGTLYAIDGDGIRCYPAFVHALTYRKNFALFLAQLPISAEPLIATALSTYLEHNPQSDPGFTDRILEDLDRARRKRRLHYVTKCTRNCGEFVRRQNFSQLAVFRRDCAGVNLESLLRDPDGFMQQGTLLKDGNSATVVKVTTSEGEWVIKRYNIKGISHALKRGLRPSRAWTSWRNAHRLNSSGIATPQAVAMLEKRIGLWRQNCYYVTKWDDGVNAATLEETSRQHHTFNLVTLFRQLFQLRIYHGDCKATNFLLSPDGPVIIDLDSMGESRWQWLFLRHYRKDRKRFLNNWPDNSSLHHYFNQHLP